MKELNELREMLCDELKNYGKKGELTAGNLTTIDTLAHAVKNLDKIIDNDGYSGQRPYTNVDERWSYRGRDGMGRYSRHGLADKLRSLMDEAPDERTKAEIRQLVDRI